MNNLDKLYLPSQWSKRFSSPEEVIQHHIVFIERASAIARHEIPCKLDIAYGGTERQKIDIFGTNLNDDASILIFFHGGYWQDKIITRASYHFLAKPFYNHHIKSIFVGYDLCPDVTLPQILQQTQNALKLCLQLAQEKKSKGVYLMGHSAGAHLVASLFIESLSQEDLLIVKGAILSSGIFDLSLLQKTVINEALKLDEEVALEMSPLKQNVFKCAGTVFYSFVGENESGEFIRQSKEFNEKLEKLGIETRLDIIANVDHFDVIELLSNEEYEVTREIVEMINNK